VASGSERLNGDTGKRRLNQARHANENPPDAMEAADLAVQIEGIDGPDASPSPSIN
jgi:hypothetical protein